MLELDIESETIPGQGMYSTASLMKEAGFTKFYILLTIQYGGTPSMADINGECEVSVWARDRKLAEELAYMSLNHACKDVEFPDEEE